VTPGKWLAGRVGAVDQSVVAQGALGVLPGGVGLPGGSRFRQGRDLPGRGDGQAGGQPGSRPPGERDRDAAEHAGQGSSHFTVR
jgi:hypothetical protein